MKAIAMQNQLLQAALAYAERGWLVLPIVPRGKTPCVKGGYAAATTDIEQIQNWWTRWPDANVGLRTGPESGIFVLDVDTKDGKIGLESLGSLMQQHGYLPTTRTATSGSGGRHYYFTDQGGLPSSAGRIGKGIDTRGSGGYIVAPPSIHESGNPYVWGDESLPLADPPAWIGDRLSKPRSNAWASTADIQDAAALHVPQVLRDAASAVLFAENGCRNQTLNLAAFNVGRAIGAGGLDETSSFETLLRAALGSGLDDREARATILSGLSTGKAKAGEAASNTIGRWEDRRDSALLTLKELAAMPPPSWLIDGYLQDGGFACLYGEPGVGKSFMALCMALCVSAGIPFNGATTREGSVVYVAAEGQRGLLRRVEAWQELHGYALTGDDLRFRIEPVHLLDAAQVHALLIRLAALPSLPALIVLDTLALCMVGGDENSQKDMGLVVAAVHAIRRETGSAVMVIHHTNKAKKEERGSNALRGAADTMIGVRRSNDGIRLVCDKQKDAEPFATSDWELRPVASSCVAVPVQSAIDTSKAAAKIHALSVNQGTMLATIQANPSGLTLTAAMKASGLPKSSTSDALAALLELGLVTKGKGRTFWPADPVNGSFGLGAYAPQPSPNTELPRASYRTFAEPNY